jgi:DNA-directed RNA polymerase specialized sigma24 family protein
MLCRAVPEAVGGATEVRPLVERHHAAMLRVASFRGAKRRDVDLAIVEAARSAATARPDEREATLFLTLLRRVAQLERETAQPESWQAEDEPAIDAKNLEAEGSRWEGWFKVDPRPFAAFERGRLTEARRAAAEAVSRLPLPQRAVVVLRDVSGWQADEVSRVLRLEPEIQRRLLHVGRSRVRRALERLAAEKQASRG